VIFDYDKCITISRNSVVAMDFARMLSSFEYREVDFITFISEGRNVLRLGNADKIIHLKDYVKP